MNDLFKKYGQPMGAPNPLANIANTLKQYEEFKKTFNGDPNALINDMIQKGQISQEQLNYVEIVAHILQNFMR